MESDVIEQPSVLIKEYEHVDSDEGGPRPIVLNLSNHAFLGACWLMAVTALLIVTMFRSSYGTKFTAATVDSDRVVEQARSYLKTHSKHKEFVEIELMQFISFVQVELDDLAKRNDISVVVPVDAVLAGNTVDYSDYIFLHAKSAYDDFVKESSSKGKGNLVGSDKLARALP